MPGLLFSVAAAMVVWRVGKEQNIGSQIGSQVFGSSKALGITAGIVGALGLLHLVYTFSGTRLAPRDVSALALGALLQGLREEVTQRGVTVLWATHLVPEAEQADRVIVLEEGRVKLDLAVPFAHPRRHGNVELADIEGQLLAAILGDEHHAS